MYKLCDVTYNGMNTYMATDAVPKKHATHNVGFAKNATAPGCGCAAKP